MLFAASGAPCRNLVQLLFKCRDRDMGWGCGWIFKPHPLYSERVWLHVQLHPLALQ